MDLKDVRQDYMQKPLEIESYKDSPGKLLESWFNDAINENLPLPNAVTLSTIGLDGFPNARVVLVKEVKGDSLVIYTDYESTKGLEIEKNKNVALTVLWKGVERQIRIRATCEKISYEESDKYFRSRPKGSQISAAASNQSQPVDFEILKTRVEAIEEEYKNKNSLPCPENWGGYKLIYDEIEFWQGRPNRLHDRFHFRKSINSWELERLSP
jgi:pyridoxamine 5'-phosphate oxidase